MLAGTTSRDWSEIAISQAAWRLDRSYQWNYGHAPALPRVRRVPSGPGGRLFNHALNSPLGIAAGPLLNAKWVEAYARLGYDILTYATVRSAYRPAWSLPNIRCVENQEPAAVVTRRVRPGACPTLAVSLGEPSTQPDVWRKDVRRVRTTVAQPVLVKLGAFRSPRALHETATKLAPWTSGFVLVHGVHRRVLDERGNPAFEGSGRESANVVGPDIFSIASRQVEEMLAWRRAGAWERAVLAVGGISTVERAQDLVREGADAALVATAALFDPLLAVRFRQVRATAVA